MSKHLKMLGILSTILFLMFGKAFGAQVAQLTLAAGGTAGVYYPLSGAMAQVIGQRTGAVNITVQTTGATVENLHLLAVGDVDLALGQSDTVHYAWNGTELFKEPIKNFRAIARLYPEPMQAVTYADSPINSIEDLKGRKVSVGPPGGGNLIIVRQILEIYGLSYEDLQPFYLSFAETANYFQDRLIHAFMLTAGTPTAAVQEICSFIPIKFIEIKGDKRDKLIKKCPFLSEEIIKSDTYRGQSKDVETVAVQALFLTREDLPEDIIYTITKGLFENVDEVRQAHYKANDTTLERATEGVSIPFHPGAIKYYKEVGVWKE